MLGFCSSPRFADHLTGPHHPERPDRLRAIFAAVRDAGLVASENPLSPVEGLTLGLSPLNLPELFELTPHPAGDDVIGLVHDAAYRERIAAICRAGGGVLDQGDTPVCPASDAVARLAVGAAIECCDAVMSGLVRRAFAAVRPPGHHAEPKTPMGFCLYSNIAIAARHLQQSHGLARVAIVDFDVHHGNGTQAAFEADPSVLFVSLHQDPRTLYPRTGFDWEIGSGPGKGTTLNIPMPPGSGDEDYLAAIEHRVVPRLQEFAPDFLLLSAGFDAHIDDPLGETEVTDEGFERITRQLVGAADQLCGGRVVSLLEGGYNLRALARSVVRHLVALQQ